MSHYQFIISHGPENPARATRAIMFASRAVEEGHDVAVFLVDDAVHLADLNLAANLRSATGDTFMQYLDVLTGAAVPVGVCLPCAKARGIAQDDLPEHWVLDKGVEAIRRAEQGYRTWTF